MAGLDRLEQAMGGEGKLGQVRASWFICSIPLD
jgi:hypothetical protein